MAPRNVVQVPAAIDIAALPAEISAGAVFLVGGSPFVCEEVPGPRLLVAAPAEGGLTTAPEAAERFFVIRRALSRH